MRGPIFLASLPLLVRGLSCFGEEYISPSPVSEADYLAIKTIVVGRHPELAASPGIKYSHFMPSVGTPGCEETDEYKSGGKTVWAAVTGSSMEEIQKQLESLSPQVSCQRPQADIYFEPFREHAGRGDGAFVRCKAPVQGPAAAEPTLGWSCDPVVFRQYVELDDQECKVTVVGEISDAGLHVIKNIGLAVESEVPLEERNVLIKFQRMRNDQAFAIFGSESCLPGEGSFLFRHEPDANLDLAESWELTNDLR